VNSNNSKAMVASGGATVVRGSSININGNYVASGGATVSPAPNVGAAPTPDPLADLQPPTIGGCSTMGKVTVSGAQTLNPGVYCGGIEVPSATGHSSIRRLRAVWRGLTVSGGGIIGGEHVSFYNTAGGSYSYKPITISGGSTATLSAPIRGRCPACCSSRTATSSQAPRTQSPDERHKIQGAVYFPTTELVYSGGSSADTVSQTMTIIARLLEFSGGSTLIDGDYDTSSSGLPRSSGQRWSSSRRRVR